MALTRGYRYIHGIVFVRLGAESGREEGRGKGSFYYCYYYYYAFISLCLRY